MDVIAFAPEGFVRMDMQLDQGVTGFATIHARHALTFQAQGLFVLASGRNADFKAFATGKIDAFGRAKDGLGKIKAELIRDIRAFDLLGFAFPAKATKTAAARSAAPLAKNLVKDVFGIGAGKAKRVSARKATTGVSATATGKRACFTAIGVDFTVVELLAAFRIPRR